ncbi:unnamed protein product [Phytomonas sp. EM1]|nr:unnamed protein product [Phytomonas sp. EM1]|eukprot:CCW61615.1 unnamed protein product [Phytomonas sp. isolate EM1]
MLQEDEFRDILCEAPVQCFVTTSDYVVWMDQGNHSLYIWTRSSGQDIQLLTELESWFEPCQMVASEDGCLLCCDNLGHVNFYTIDVLRVVPEAHLQDDKPLNPMEDRDEVFDESLSSPNRAGVKIQEKCSILQRWSLQLSASGALSHADIAPGGLLTALSTSGHLLLVLRSPEGNTGGSFPRLEDDALAAMDGEVHNYSFLSAHTLFCGENRHVSKEGCVRTCFLSTDRLCILFADNHLIAVQVHLDDVLQLTTSFLRDGHIITHKHTVVAMAAGSVQECLLVIGLSNGLVHVLHAERLEVFKVLDTQAMLTAYFGKSLSHAYSTRRVGTQPKRSDPSSYFPSSTVGMGQQVREHAADLARVYGSTILDITLGNWICIATPRSVLHVDKHTLLLDEGGVQSIAGDDLCEPLNLELDDAHIEDSQRIEIQCAPNGSWGAWFAESLTLRYYSSSGFPLQPSLSRWAHAQDAEGGEVDVVHARMALPRRWLGPPPAEDPPRPPVKAVRSSNYTEAPWSVQQERKRKLKARAGACAKGLVPAESDLLMYNPRVPYEAHPFAAAGAANRVLATRAQVHQAVVRSNCFTANGGALVTTSGDRSAYYLKLPLSRYQGDGAFLRAHTAAVLSSSINMSLKTPMVATSGADGVIHVWKPTVCEAPLLAYTLPKGSEGAGNAAAEIRAVRFYYMDKFLCFTSQNRVMLSQHTLGRDQATKSPWPTPASKKSRSAGGGGRDGNLDNGASGTLPRILDPIFTYAINEAQNITAMDCINHFVSTLVVLASSNKQICVLDLAAEAPLRVMNEAHSRQIHHVAMCTGSRFADGTCSLSAQHLFATSGLDGAVYVWDLRQSKPVRQFALHKNQALPTLGLAFSPDGSMLGVGSENDAVYVYDVGMGGGAVPIDKLCCPNVPTAIAWHPIGPLMAVGLATGQTMFFSQR